MISALIELFDWHARGLADFLRRVIHQRGLELIEVLAALLDEGFILPAFFEDDVHQPVDQGDVGAGLLADV